MDGGIRIQRHVSQCEGLLRREKPRLLVHLLALSLSPFHPPFVFPTLSFTHFPPSFSLSLTLSCSVLKSSIQTRRKQTKRLARTSVSPSPEQDAEDTNPKAHTLASARVRTQSITHIRMWGYGAKNTHTWRVVVPPSYEGQHSDQTPAGETHKAHVKR